jgi:multidrug efflux pump subunit AcrA (membrane-fusion protein)
MHPDYKAARPGDCPICNMALVKLEPGESLPPAEAAAEGETSMAAGTVRITPQKQQLIGVQATAVARRHVVRTIRTIGQVSYDERRVARVQPRIEGWIEAVHVDFAGKWVKQHEPLLSIYSPELFSTQQELLIARRALETLGDSAFEEVAAGARSLYESTRQRLLLWDISAAEIRDIERRGTPSRTLTLHAPIAGYVLTRNAYRGQRITPETELYTIADLSSVWVLADIYEYEIPMIRLGQAATMTFPYFPGITFTGKVTYIYPQLDNATRTLKVRLEYANPKQQLKPEMYANVQVVVDLGEQLAVPHTAVLDAGMERIVFVALGEGYFEPRRVQLGARVDDSHIVMSGLEEGEQVVTAGNFLIDSESQLKSALGGMTAGGADHAVHSVPPPAGGSQERHEHSAAPR